MTASLQDDLSALTGEEIYNLTAELDQAIDKAESRARRLVSGTAESAAYLELCTELIDVRCITHAQIARITIPIREAAAIIYRARYARNHPVRVAGT